jgi:hypothetical protein
MGVNVCYMTSSRGATMCVCNVAEADGSTVEVAARTAQRDGSRQRRKLELLLAVHTLLRIFARSPQHRYSLARGRKGNVSRPSCSLVGFTASSSSPPTSQLSGGHHIPPRRPARRLSLPNSPNTSSPPPLSYLPHSAPLSYE